MEKANTIFIERVKLFINDDNEKKNPSIKIEVERKTPLYRIHLIPINNK